ncbi:hypothetical protein CICLE_v10003167mg [Citrus x clementina]|uniref:Uncharacterized protein n=1 Tax=Citrus clementina TaxID=85681 RepID=V4SDN9_CITCL|nr:hypothetical protein CICLE_v10003167mg [Citrus x clementina]
MNALKDLGLDVTKGAVNTEGSVKQSKFCITRLKKKVKPVATLCLNRLISTHYKHSSIS